MLKYKLKESALVNVSRLQINILRGKLIYTIVKVRNCECSVSVTSGNGDRFGNYCMVQQKIHLFSATNYTANLYSATILLMS